MRAVLLESFRTLPGVRTVPDPEPHEDAVVVRVEATGLCRSDWHAWAGHDAGVTVPHVPGHEFVGRVVRVGSGVHRVAAGDRITVPFVCGCGDCLQCRAGNAQVCPRQTQPGFTHWGSFAELVEVRHADFNAVEVPEDADARDLVGLGCRFATAFRGLHGRARVRPGERVAVFGCGGVGLSAVMIAAALGARVIAVDISQDALALAERHGAEATVNSTGLEPAEIAARITAGEGTVPVTVEALGLEATAQAALLSLSPGGRHVQIGLFADEPSLPVGRMIALELSFLGAHGMAAADYPPMLDLVARGQLKPGRLVTRELGLDEVPGALATMAERPWPGVTVITP
ncbi:alcohol dehydrogenase catalytic domain-containing protein [Sediminivirga luteola]|uniref:Alcohol dehydrogenase n=1 Tax=Sediminivirga luteola TaxID=1774748 RepID=A0A8J2U1E8_9MICO|nr:alcohol dehydrogenase catalytic domain-containing protein [Sediminivirga luteola]MCI2265189.1 alcohol dehydrogenase catalytic domain-containing protein [Sediminivirga luteola]GGA29114.1 alcohol dehydrogenase [Sediminivirga luteola]